MKNLLPSRLVKRSLEGHSWIGVLVGALMYVVCLTGTLCVVYPEFERWEQPEVAESTTFDVDAVEAGFNRFLADDGVRTTNMYLNLPTAEHPRLAFSNEEAAWFVGPEGAVGDESNHDWTHLLIDAHLYLTLPWAWGIVLVSALGALLLSLIVSGFLSHPRIFKDAFRLRLSGGDRMEQVDLHNRLSVWGAPFYVIIAVTGAYFGLVTPLLAAIGGLTHRDTTEIASALYPQADVPGSAGPVRVGAILGTLSEVDPSVEPFSLAVLNAGTESQFVEVYAIHPGRMIYSDSYRFESDGRYVGNAGYSDGEVGRQVVYSTYRLHFGHFGGLAVKLLYIVLGFALTVISVTGINIWLAKRRRRDVLDHGWVGVVWGVPIALVLTMLTQITVGLASVSLFWGIVLAMVVWCLKLADPARAKRTLLWVLVATCGSTLTAHLARFGTDSLGPAARSINLGLLLTTVALAAHASAARRQGEGV